MIMRLLEIEKQPTLDQTLEFIKSAHEGQSYGGKPYWHHPLGVMNLLTGATEDEQHAALLHDVIEDTPYTSSDLKAMGYSNTTIKIVELLSNNISRPNGMSYLEWIEKVIIGSGNRSAMKIKYADNKFNHDASGKGISPEKKEGLKKRYAKSMEILKRAM